MKTLQRLMVTVMLSALCAGTVAAQTVSNVRSSQRAGTKLIDIYYDVAYTGAAVNVGVQLTDDGADIGAGTFTGDIGSSVAVGTDKHIVWNAEADWNGHFSEKVRADVRAAPEGMTVALDRSLYMVVDITEGTNTATFPVTYYASSFDVPGGMTNDIYKTTHLLMRLIEAGSDPLGRYTLTKDFYCGVYEVTQDQWNRVMGPHGHYFAGPMYPDGAGYYMVRENPGNTDDPAVYWPSNSTVNPVSFMGQLRAKTGLDTFDLPTEAQWEYASRAGSTNDFESGNVDDYAWHYGNSGGRPHDVGTKLPNNWGLYDMIGNAHEWCLDAIGMTWDDGWGEWVPGSPFPSSTIDPVGVVSGPRRAYRGGFAWTQQNLGSGLRAYWYEPNYNSDAFGYRVFRVLP